MVLWIFPWKLFWTTRNSGIGSNVKEIITRILDLVHHLDAEMARFTITPQRRDTRYEGPALIRRGLCWAARLYEDEQDRWILLVAGRIFPNRSIALVQSTWRIKRSLAAASANISRTDSIRTAGANILSKSKPGRFRSTDVLQYVYP